jgi:hypothetical protein
MSAPDLESARALIAALREAADRFASDLDAPPNDVTEFSQIWDDFLLSDLHPVYVKAQRLRREAFLARRKPGLMLTPGAVLSEHELETARILAGDFVAEATLRLASDQGECA